MQDGHFITTNGDVGFFMTVFGSVLANGKP